MAENAKFNELTVNTLNIGKTGKMIVQSATAVDFVAGDARLTVDNTDTSSTRILLNANKVLINNIDITTLTNDCIKTIKVNGAAIPTINNTVDLTIDNNYLPLSGGTVTGETTFTNTLTIGTNNTTVIENDTLTTGQINVDDLRATSGSLGSFTFSDNTFYNSAVTINTNGITVTSKSSLTDVLKVDTIQAFTNNSNVTVSSPISLTSSATLSTVPTNNIDITNKEYVDTALNQSLSQLIYNDIKMNILTDDSDGEKFNVYTKFNINSSYNISEIGFCYKSNIENVDTIDDDLKIDETGVIKVVFSNTDTPNFVNNNKGFIKKQISITDTTHLYGIRPYLIIDNNTIYGNTEVISYSSLQTIEQEYPYIWVE